MDWASGKEEERQADWAGVGRYERRTMDTEQIESRCGCYVCTPYADGCEGLAEHTAVGAEATVELCASCYHDHRDAALAVVETNL